MTNSVLADGSVVAVIGAGAMGAGIAQVAAQAGHHVLLYDARVGAADGAIVAIRDQLAGRVTKGKVSPEFASDTVRRLQPVGALEHLHEASLAIEAIVENLEAKQQLFSRLEEIVDESAILATNTSSISVTTIGSSLRRSERLVGMHFFNPAVAMPLVEVVSGVTTRADIARDVHALAERWGKTPVYARSTPGFIVNRLARPFYAEALRLLQEGVASPATLDEVMRECGEFRMGPFELMDLIGHDVNYSVTRSVFDAYYGDPRYAPSLIQLELVNAGFLGRKAGRGFYNYAEDAQRPEPQREDPVAAPQDIVLNPTQPLGEALGSRLVRTGVGFTRSEQGLGADDWVAQCGSATLAVTDGRTASHRSAAEGIDNLVLLDLMLTPDHAAGVAVTYSARCSDEARTAAIGLLQAAGLSVYPVADSPGLVVMRTVAMLANEACDAVHQGVCTPIAADIAMRGGVSYPLGPVAWGERIGVRGLLKVIEYLHEHYQEARYRASPRLRQMLWSGAGFYD